MNTFLKIFFLFLSYTLCSQVCAQSTDTESNYNAKTEPIPYLSPEAASLGKYGEIPVSEYTGLPQIEIPLYTVKSGELELPITLSYHASGIKVNQESTWVGLGWDLMAGGCISRVVSGKNDMAASYFQNQYEDDWLQQLLNLNSDSMFSCTIQFCTWAEYGMSPEQQNFYKKLIAHYYEPDLFTANFCGQNMTFYIDPYTDEVVQTGKIAGNYKIEKYRQGNLIDIDRWVITDDNGIRYYFGCDATERYQNETYEADVTLYATTWNLYKIEHPMKGEITFSFSQPYTIWPTPEVSETFTWLNGSPTRGEGGEPAMDYDGIDFIGNVTHNIDLASYVGNKNSIPAVICELGMKKPYISSIAADNCRIAFLLSDRSDINGKGKKLSSIVISDNNNNVKQTIILHYSNFHSSVTTQEHSIYNYHSCNIYKNERLRLDSITVNDKNYSFSYNNMSLPSKTSNSQDYWGYYNGKQNRHLIDIPFYENYSNAIADFSFHNEIFVNADRMPDINYAVAGMLEEITYPTKGKTHFEYEMHTFANDFTCPSALVYPSGTTNCQGGGLRIKSITQMDSDNRVLETKSYCYDDTSGRTTGLMMLPATLVKNEKKYYVQDLGEGPELYYANICSASSSYSCPAFTSVNAVNVGYSKVTTTNGNSQTIATFINQRPCWSQTINTDGVFHIYNYGQIESISESVFQNNDFKYNEGFYYWKYLDNGMPITKAIYDIMTGRVLYSEESSYDTMTRTCDKINMYAVNVAENVFLTRPNCPTFRVLAYPFVSERTLTKKQINSTLYGNSLVSDTISYTYNDSTYRLSELRKSTEIPNMPMVYDIKYPTDNVSGYDTSVQQNMISRNMLAYPIETRLSFMGNILERNRNVYTNKNIGDSIIPVLTERQWAQGTHNYSTRLKLQYDTYGNCVEVRKSDNKPVSYIWGYNRTLPVAMIEGVAYNTIDGTIINDIGSASNNSDLDTYLNTLSSRYVLGKFYTYDPLVGVKSEMQPNGYKINYQYDSFGRLRQMFDNFGGPRLLKSFDYNYRH